MSINSPPSTNFDNIAAAVSEVSNQQLSASQAGRVPIPQPAPRLEPLGYGNVSTTYTRNSNVYPSDYAPGAKMCKGGNCPKGSSYSVPASCSPTGQPVKCPISIYIFLMVLMAIVNIWATFRVPRINSNGRPITTGVLWTALLLGVAFHITFGLFFGWWLYERCQMCLGVAVAHGLTFSLAVLIPFVLGVMTGLIIGGVMGVGFVWTASVQANGTDMDNCGC